MAHRPTPACHQVGAPALHLSSLHGSSDMAQHLLAIRWVPLHCICQHCMAPQTWLIAQHLPAIRWVPPALHLSSLHGSSDMAHCSTPACHQVGPTAPNLSSLHGFSDIAQCTTPAYHHNRVPLHVSSLYGSSSMAHCSTPACHQVGPPALHLLLLDGLMDVAHGSSAAT